MWNVSTCNDNCDIGRYAMQVSIDHNLSLIVETFCTMRLTCHDVVFTQRLFMLSIVMDTVDHVGIAVIIYKCNYIVMFKYRFMMNMMLNYSCF